MLSTILGSVFLACSSAVISLGGVGLNRLMQWIEQRAHNDRVTAVLERVNTLVMMVVKEVYQAYAQPLKDSGKWDAVTSKAAKSKALVALQNYLGTKGLAEIAWLLSGNTAAPSTGQAIASFLGTAIESAVHDLGQDHAALTNLIPGPAPSPPPPPMSIQKDGSTAAGLPPFLSGQRAGEV